MSLFQKLAQWLAVEPEPVTEEQHECELIADCPPRSIVRVSGTVDMSGVNPTVGWFEAHLVDGSGEVRLIWMGRKQMAGVQEGTKLVAVGRLALRDGKNVIYNPEVHIIEP